MVFAIMDLADMCQSKIGKLSMGKLWPELAHAVQAGIVAFVTD